MDQRRVGRALWVLRRARSLRQSDIAQVAGVSQATVSGIERGRWESTSLRTLRRAFDAVEADVDVVVRYRGGELDRLLDERHAAVVTYVAAMLAERGWFVQPEVSFNHYGDRGSIDLMAFHPPTRTILVVEAKTEIASAEETLRRIDVKARLAPSLARACFGGDPARVVRFLAIRGSTANRARVARLGPIFGPTFPLRGRALLGWLRAPDEAAGGHGGGRGGIRGGTRGTTGGGALLFVRDISAADRKRARRGPRGAARTPGGPGRA